MNDTKKDLNIKFEAVDLNFPAYESGCFECSDHLGTVENAVTLSDLERTGDG